MGVKDYYLCSAITDSDPNSDCNAHTDTGAYTDAYTDGNAHADYVVRRWEQDSGPGFRSDRFGDAYKLVLAFRLDTIRHSTVQLFEMWQWQWHWPP